MIIGAILPPIEHQNNMSLRLVRHFNIISIDPFDDDIKRAIFQPMLDWHFNKSGIQDDFLKIKNVNNSTNFFNSKFFKKNKNSGIFKSLVEATIKLFNRVSDTFLPTPRKFHYLFNLRDFSRKINVIIFIYHKLNSLYKKKPIVLKNIR
jgi:dynein heavy chain